MKKRYLVEIGLKDHMADLKNGSRIVGYEEVEYLNDEEFLKYGRQVENNYRFIRFQTFDQFRDRYASDPVLRKELADNGLHDFNSSTCYASEHVIEV